MTIINKDLIILIGGKAFQVIIALVSIKVLTSIFSEEDLGRYYLLLTVVTLFDFAFFNSVGQYFGRHVIEWQGSGRLKQATISLILFRIFASLFSVLAAYVVYILFSYEKYYSANEFLIFIFIYLLVSAYLVLLNNLNTLGERVAFIKFLCLTLFFGLFFSYLITVYLLKNEIGWLYGIVLSQLLFFYPVLKYYLGFDGFVSLKLNKAEFKKIFYFILPVTITLFLQWGQNTSYRIIIEERYSIELVAYIAVGFSVASAIFNAVSSLLTQYLYPIYLKEITNSSKGNRTQAWNRLASIALPVYLCLMLFIISFAPFILKVLVDEKFHGAYIYVALGAVIEFLRSSTNLVYMISQSEVKTNALVLPYFLGFVLCLSLLSMLNFEGQLYGVPLVLVASYLTTYLFLYISMKKILPVRVDLGAIFKSTLLSLPFLLGFYFYGSTIGLLGGLFLLFIFGCYFMFCVYLIVLRWA